MSGTGSLMIRNLRKPSDYSKAVMTQDELLRIAIANDANISGARTSFQRGETIPLSQQQLKSPAELQADLALQERMGLDNLLRLFQYREASSILAELSPDEIFTMNQSFPSIERDVNKKFAKGLLSPTFFIEYLRKFKEEIEASKGVSTNLSMITNKFNTLTDNITDLQTILPTKQQFEELERKLSSAFRELPNYIVQPVLERLNRLQDTIPSKKEFQAVSQDNEILQFETLAMIQELTSNMPTQVQVQRVIDDINSGRVDSMVGFQEIQDALSGVTDTQLDGLEELKRELAESGRLGTTRDIEIEAQISLPVPNIPTLAIAKRIISGTPARTSGVYVIYSDGRSEEIDSRGLDKAYRGNQDFKDWCDANLRRKPTISNLKQYIMTSSQASSSAVSDATSREDFSISTEKFGFGLKAKNGRIRTKKIGEGVKYEPEPLYRQLGKYVINIQQLKERDI
ncbi:MAG: hypothetical protein NTW30_04970, partial [Candidatus Aenigmarchaeota archaeon]|nr:hypothetical protein [Candidatus Aenigmarchaeota archaeon]